MIETEEALAQAREIAAVPGVAGLFVGPYDLGIALGVAFEEVRTSPVLASALHTVREACDEARIVAGCFASGAEHAARVIAEGYRMVSLGGDATLLINAARSELEAVRGRLSGEVVVGYGG
jgi:4-hydroxy-2-oxoheptanedioate aldolase